MSVWADDNDEWCGGGSIACDFGPKRCNSGVCRHYGRCMARDAEDAGQQTQTPARVDASDGGQQ